MARDKRNFLFDNMVEAMALTHHQVVPSQLTTLLTILLQMSRYVHKLWKSKFTNVYNLWIYIHILNSVYGRFALGNVHISFSMFYSQALL